MNLLANSMATIKLSKLMAKRPILDYSRLEMLTAKFMSLEAADRLRGTRMNLALMRTRLTTLLLVAMR